MVLPTRLGPFAATRVLTWPQKARAGLDLLLPRRLGPDDTSIGAFLRARLGDGVVERFAQPLVGGIYGAGVDRLSLDAVLPSLRDSERDHRSLMLASLAQGRAARRRAGAVAPASPFRTLAGGLGSLAEALADQARALGADLRTGSVVVSLTRSEGCTTATLADGSSADFDAVVVAVGAAAMAELLAAHAPAAAAALRQIPQASSTVVTLALPVAGFRVPPTSQGWLEVGPAPISGVTISSTKWAGRAPAGTVLLRAFVPDRLGPLARRPDAELLDAVIDHVSTVLGFTGQPQLTRVSRWTDVMPTYTVGHLDRVEAVESALAGLPGWQVAGAALHGVGIPECIADGRRAARAVLGAGSTASAQL
jgi:oxygen-dependent protoporphyrinogen oxidase